MEQRRLHILHEVFFSATQAYLINAGISSKSKEKFKVLDAGCASGLMTEWFCNQNIEKIYAVDLDDKQLKHAKNYILQSQHDLTNVVFKQANISDPFELEEQVDITYCRFLLHHLQNPKQGFENLIHATKSGGYILIGEPILDGAWCEPHHESYLKIISQITQFFNFYNKDPNFGKSLVTKLSEFDKVDIIQVGQFRPVLIKPEHRIHNFYALSLLKEQMITSGLASESKIDYLLQVAQEIAQGAQFVTDLFGCVFVLAKKK